MLLLNDSGYDSQRWHGTLLIIAVATVAILLNVFLAKQLPRLEVLMLVLHIVGFLAIVIVLWVLAPRTPARVVFTNFQNNGDWPNLGLSILIGLTGPVYSMIASDCAVHMGGFSHPPLFGAAEDITAGMRLIANLNLRQQPRKSEMPLGSCLWAWCGLWLSACSPASSWS